MIPKTLIHTAIRRLALITGLGVLGNSGASAQIWEDSKGQSTILVPAGGTWVAINTGDASLRAAYGWLTNSGIFGGVGAKAMNNSGVGGLLTRGAAAPGASLDGFLGFKLPGNTRVAVRGAYERSQLVLLELGQDPDSQIVKEGFDGYDVGAHLWNTSVNGTDFAIGLAGGVRRVNNFASLTEGELITTTAVTDTTTGRMREFRTVHKGRVGDYAEEAAAFVYGDLAYKLPSSWINNIGLRGFVRWTRPKTEANRRLNIGLDVMLLQNNDLGVRRIGLVFELEDVQKNMMVAPGETRPRRFGVSLVGALNL